MILQEAFTVEPWALRETHLDMDLLAQTESVFALSNGHLGWRGNLDEGEPHGLPGSYLNGVYEVKPLPYAEAATRLVLRPLGLRDSSFPPSRTDVGPGAVTSYHLTREGTFEPTPALIPTIPAAGGLWSTGADLVRLGLGWSSLLPGSLAHEALTPQAEPPPGPGQRPACGLGWLISPRGDMAVHAGGGIDGTASLAIRIRDNRTHLVLTSRLIPVNSIGSALRGAWTNPEE